MAAKTDDTVEAVAGTEVVLVDFPEQPELEGPQPLSEGKARQLDKRIRAASSRVVDQASQLMALLEEAALGQIHVALGYPSWTAYVKDAVQITPVDDTQRKALVSLMSGKGMSQRAIADVVGVNQATVSRDLKGDASASTGESVGTDGKTYKREPKKPKEEPLDVEVVEEPVKIPPVSADFADEMAYLLNSVSSFKDILEDERFPKARKTIAKRHLNKLTEAISELQKVVDVLMEG